MALPHLGLSAFFFLFLFPWGFDHPPKRRVRKSAKKDSRADPRYSSVQGPEDFEGHFRACRPITAGEVLGVSYMKLQAEIRWGSGAVGCGFPCFYCFVVLLCVCVFVVLLFCLLLLLCF